MRRPLLITGLVLAQAALITASVAPQLILRATGETRDVAVVLTAPWSGSNVQVDVVGLDAPWETPESYSETWSLPEGTLHLPMIEEDGVWTVTGHQRERPDGVHLTCDSDGWSIDCGFNFFQSAALADALPAPERNEATPGVATLRTNDDGESVLVDVRIR